MPEKHKKLLEINLKKADQYKFVLWNEEKIFTEIKNDFIEPFVLSAYKDRKYAFLSDAIKLFACYKYGGWAIDADVEIIKPFNTFENYNCISGFETAFGVYAFTAVWGSISKHKFMKTLLNKYYDVNNYYWLTTIPNTTWIGGDFIKQHGGILNNTYQYIENLDIHLFPANIFCGSSQDPETYAVHHFTGSWL